MATYIVLGQWTQQGMRDIKESASRLAANKELFATFGVELKGAYLVLGQYDFVMIVDAADDETIAKLLLIVGSKGSVRTETLRAFAENEYQEIIESLP
ncbi:GYD domain-containing protein [Leptolyngbya sp. FACHB-261]|uniref:GYD domain-containing protein n=1 Tax=Leptolyngbya sp. FACHB-261 TaxID=2692806 RepID=UPI001686A011|nr:GYD domain-containing protein [Leptolyngbya sp. FACHB-261]MBD2099955.1 GYD domain-containing protein [Leptolyngbya sp. FACHB-261]